MDIYGVIGAFKYDQQRHIDIRGVKTDITEQTQSGRFLRDGMIVPYGKFDDPFGPSEIEGLFEANILEFDKQYRDGSDRVHYRFEKQGDLWVGTWRAKSYSGTGWLQIKELQKENAGMHSFHLDVRDR